MAQNPAAGAPASEQPLLREGYGKLPLSFVANTGQTDASVKFISRGPGYGLFLTAQEAVIVASRRAAPNQVAPSADTPESAVVRMQLRGANPDPQVTGADELTGKVNYLLANDPAKWRTNVPTFAKVRYRSVYPGIDMVYYGQGQQLEYDFVVAPGADPGLIQLAFEGISRMGVDESGNLVLEAAGGDFRLLKPIVYQHVQGKRQEVSGEYVLFNQNEVGVKLGYYDTRETLVIDPILSYSTSLGGGGSDRGFAIAVDGSGNAYVTGDTYSTDFPTATPFQGSYHGGSDAFVTKLNPAGSLVYSTYFGGSSYETGFGIKVDGSGNAHVTGQTMSSDFSLANPYQGSRGDSTGDAFLTKLNATGSGLVYSTYLGGNNTDIGYAIGIDVAGNTYVTGSTRSNDFPTNNAFQPTLRGGNNAFVTKFNSAGSALIYSTYLGGGGTNAGYAIAADSSGNAYVTGSTGSSDFPVVNAFDGVTNCVTFNPPRCTAVDAFVTKFSASGSAVYSTYLGGSSFDEGYGIAVDGSGNAYVTGVTYVWGNFPIVNAFQPNQPGSSSSFVTKFNAAGSALVYSTYLGAGFGHGIALDGSGNAYVTGRGGPSNFPIVNPIQQSSGSAFVTKFNAAGSALIYSTNVGGSEGKGIAVDGSGTAYMVGIAASAGQSDAFVVKLTDGDAPPPPTLTSITPTSGGQGSTVNVTLTGTNFVGGSITVTVSGGGVTVGTLNVTSTQLTTTFTIASSASAGARNVTVTTSAGTSNAVTFNIGPALNVSPATLSFTGSPAVGNPNSQTLSVASSDGSAISWTASASTTSGGNWLTLSPSSGTTPATISVSPNVAGLGVGTYNGTIQVASAAAINSPRTVPVTLTVVNPNPVPSINNLSPNSRAAGLSGFTLSVNGSNFISGSVIQWNGSNRSTNFVGATQLQTAILSSEISSAGTAQVTVMNPGPGGGVSNALAFTISGPNTPPSIVTQPANQTISSGQPATLSVVAGGTQPLIYQWYQGNSGNTATPVSTGSSFTTAPLTVTTSYWVRVTNAQGSADSNTATVTVNSNNPSPTLSGLSPSSTAAGGPGFTLTVTGSNFISGSVVQWNGLSRTTTFLSSTQVQAAILASDIAAAGTAQVTIFNPTPGGGTSNALTFTISAPASLSSLNPNNATAGGSGFNLIVNGSGFTSSAVVQWNGSSRSTTFLSSTQLQAAISSSDIATDGTAQVTVVSGGATSNAVVFVTFAASGGSSRQFSIAPRGLASMTTTGASPSMTIGYASVQPDIGSATPSGAVMFGLRTNGVLVSETSVPTSPAIQGGRLYAEIGGSVNTGVAIANAGTQDAFISFYYTDSSGQQVASGSTTVPAGRQIARFLNESPFGNLSSLQGTFTFSSSAPVAVIAIRGLTNQRGEFLMTTLPVTPLTAGTSQPVVLAQFADGQGWATTLLLVNPTDNDIAGTVQFLDGSGQARTLTVGGSTGNSFPYAIRGRSSQRLVTSGTGTLQVGSMHIVPASGQAAPVALGVFAYTQNGITVSQAGVSLIQGSIVDLYAEKSQGGAIQSGIAIANTSSNATMATVQIFASDGSLLGGATLQIPGRGQTARYLDELFPWITAPFQGILRVSSTAGDLSVMGLRLRINERGDVLTTASPAASEGAVGPSGAVYVPHLVDGGGFTSQFIFIGTSGTPSSATMRFFTQSGSSLTLN